METEFTFILPCLNEEKSLDFCIKEIKQYIIDKKLNAEILVVDNNSTDNSINIAKQNNVRVIVEKVQGYGSALIAGTNNSFSKYCIMGDSDGSYDFSHLDDFIKKLRDGNDLVVGNRFLGRIEKSAMPLSHKFGVNFLSNTANLFFKTPIHDYHCGLRAYNTLKIKELDLCQLGMEYASEMIIKSKINGLSMVEVPTVLRKDKRNGQKSHLRTIRDGFRHLALIFSLIGEKKK